MSQERPPIEDEPWVATVPAASLSPPRACQNRGPTIGYRPRGSPRGLCRSGPSWHSPRLPPWEPWVLRSVRGRCLPRRSPAGSQNSVCRGRVEEALAGK